MQRVPTQRIINRRSFATGVPYWNTKVYIKINEGKNLPAKDMNGLSDPYCTIKVDDENVARTSIVWKQLNPFFGEEFALDMATDFQELSIFVHDFDSFSADDPIGFVTISRELLQSDQSLAQDNWYPLTKICRDTVCMGEIQVELLLSETETGLDQLTVTVIQARDLCPDIKIDPFAVVELDMAKLPTEKAKATRFPVWKQSFSFERAKLAPDMRVSVRSGGGLGGSTFLGEAFIILSNLQKDIPKREWYRLRPRDRDIEHLKEGNGSLRLSIKFSHELVLPFGSYKPLVDYLVGNVQTTQQIEQGIVGLLENIISERDPGVIDREQLGRILIRILINQNSCSIFLRNINFVEISKAKESSTLFRGNSLASKCTDQFMKIVGLRYLHETVKPGIDDIFKEQLNCEIDPCKLTEKKNVDDVIQKNMANLKKYLDHLFNNIFESDKRCPLVMRIAFKHLRLAVTANSALASDGTGTQTSYTVVSGFLFLRFFAPAVLSPKLFGMRDDFADLKTSRTLTLLAKALQTVGNIGSTIGSGKESYMEPLSPVLLKAIDRVKDFIDRICAVSDVAEDMLDLEEVKNPQASDELLISGVYPVRYDTDGVFTTKPFKKLEVQLTNKRLVTWKPGQLSSRMELPTERISSIDQIDQNVFDKKFVIRVVFRGLDPLFIMLPTSAEYDAWLQILRKVAKIRSADQANGVHTGVYRKNKWSCCRGPEPTSAFCSKAHSTTAVDQFADNPEPEVWVHRLFSFLLASRAKIDSKAAESKDGSITKATTKALMSTLDDINLAYLLHHDHPLN